MSELPSAAVVSSPKRVTVWHGKKKYNHTNDFMIELLKLERMLDSLSQRSLRDFNSDNGCYVCLQNCGHKQLQQALGICRSLLGKKDLAWKQKSLKRWQQIRPNHLEVGQ